jgi:hypothetical protein
MQSAELDRKLRAAIDARDPAALALVEYVLRTDDSLLDEPLFHIVRVSDRAMRTFDGRWTTHRIGAGMWTKAEAEHIDRDLMVGSHAVFIIPEGTSPYVDVGNA